MLHVKNQDGHSSTARRGGRPSRRDQLLAAAVELFATGGTRGTTLEAIARQIGVTRAAITHHFKTKEALLREVAEVSDLLDAAAVDPDEPVTGLDRLNALRKWSGVVSRDSRLANLARLNVVMTIEAFDASYPARDDRIGRYRRFREGTAAIVRTGQADGSIRSDTNPDHVAAQIIGFMEGVGIQWVLDPKSVDIVAVYDSFFDRLTSELSPPEAKTKLGRRAPASKKDPPPPRSRRRPAGG